MNPLVIQSHRGPPQDWIQICIDSVRTWCEFNGFDYRFIDDQIFDDVPQEILQKTKEQKVIATDIARLQAIRSALAGGYETVVWLDADFYIFNSEGFILPEDDYAVGREVWVQKDRKGDLKVYKKVHNAFLMFRSGNAFLDFYLHTALRLVRENTGGMPDQFVGPKLLTALHNVVGLPVMESAGMLSPLVVRDLAEGGGAALDRFVAKSPCRVAGANLCTSSVNKGQLTSRQIMRAMDALPALFRRY